MSAESQLPTDSPQEPEVVLLIHGIRTRANWMPMVARVLKEIPHVVEVYTIKYGYFDAFRFWSPLFTRNRPIEFIYRQLEIVRDRHPGARISIVAHSFGTYAISRILEAHADVDFHRLVLCGSIIPNVYRWDLVKSRFATRVINDYGTRDIWPILAKTLSWGYGDTGSNGFGVPDVRDRAHDYSHGDFFNEAFVRDFWHPWFSSGKIVPSVWDEQVPPKPFWLNMFGLLPMQWILVAMFFFAMFLGFRYRQNQHWLSDTIRVHGIDVKAHGQQIDRDFSVEFLAGSGIKDQAGKEITFKKGQEIQLTRHDLMHIDIAKCDGFVNVPAFSLPEIHDGLLRIPFVRGEGRVFYEEIWPKNLGKVPLPGDETIRSRLQKNREVSHKVRLLVHNHTPHFIDVLLSPQEPAYTKLDDGPIDFGKSVRATGNRTWDEVSNDPIAPSEYSGVYNGFKVEDGYFLIAVSFNAAEANVVHHDALYIAQWVVLDISPSNSSDAPVTCKVIPYDRDPRPTEKEK